MGFLLRAENWPLEWPLAGLVVAAVLYALGGRRNVAPPTPARRLRTASFYGGLVAVALAVDSPVDAYADTLFWAHMLQHVLLMMVAPPLVLLGRPWPRSSRPLPLAVRRPVVRALLAGDALAPVRRAARRLSSPLVAFSLFSANLVVWHVPALFDLTLRNVYVHDLEHVLFFGSSLLVWSHLLVGVTVRPRLTDGARVALGAGVVVVTWLLAVVLGFAPSPVYDAYAALAHRPGGISALADQQLAAGIMWVPGSVPVLVALLFALFRWLDPVAAPHRRAELRLKESP